MQDSNYYQVSGWMINRLNLKGTELQIYAIIYGFSQDGESEFTGNIRYLSEWTSSTKKTIITALKSLVEKDIIIKNTVDMNGVIFNRYKANLSIVNGEKEVNPQCKNYTTPSVKITPPPCKNYTDPSVKITPNNNIYNTNDNKKDNTLIGKADGAGAKKKDTVFEDFAGGNNELLKALKDFESMRKLIKKPMSERAKEILLSNLEKLSKDSNTQIKILEQSIVHNWQSVYELKEGDKNNSKDKPQVQNDSDWFVSF